MSKQPLCKDCVHHASHASSSWCTSPKNKRVIDHVNGARHEVTVCADQRAVFWGFDVLNGRCGKRARWFVQKPSPFYGGLPPTTTHDADMYDVGSVDYRFLGVTGEEK